MSYRHKTFVTMTLQIEMIIFITSIYITQTGNTMSFMLYLLASNPQAQERLHEEVTSVLQGRSKVTPSDLDKMTYVKAVTKEGQRYGSHRTNKKTKLKIT